MRVSEQVRESERVAQCLGLRYRCAKANANKEAVLKESQSAPFSRRHFPSMACCLFLIVSLLVLYAPPPNCLSLPHLKSDGAPVRHSEGRQQPFTRTRTGAGEQNQAARAKRNALEKKLHELPAGGVGLGGRGLRDKRREGDDNNKKKYERKEKVSLPL